MIFLKLDALSVTRDREKGMLSVNIFGGRTPYVQDVAFCFVDDRCRKRIFLDLPMLSATRKETLLWKKGMKRDQMNDEFRMIRMARRDLSKRALQPTLQCGPPPALAAGSRATRTRTGGSLRRSRNQRCVWLFLILFIAIGGATAHATSASFDGPHLIVKSGETQFRLSNIADPDAFFTTVHAAARKGRDFYLVIGSSELTRGWPPKGGNCGCGIESFIRWLHVRDGKVIDTQEGLYESCRLNRDGWNIGWKDGKLIWSTGGWKRSVDSPATGTATLLSWTYDPQQPDQGIVEEEKPDPWQPTKK